MTEDNSEYILNIAEMLLIELSNDSMISKYELESRVVAIMMLIPSNIHKEQLILNLEIKDQENGCFKNYHRILEIIKKHK